MRPSELRVHILCEHEHLRTQLAAIETLAARVLCGKRPSEELLRVALGGLAVSLEKHMSKEDKLLVPAILEVDAWGPVRVERMMEEHKAQRAMIVQLNSLSHSGDSAELARSARALSKTLIEDMKREETELLHPDLLRDDVVAISQFVG